MEEYSLSGRKHSETRYLKSVEEVLLVYQLCVSLPCGQLTEGRQHRQGNGRLFVTSP
jgi:hypothetical protein